MTGKSPAIRLTTPADAEALARLRYEFRVALGEPNETEHAFVARCASWMRVRLAARPVAWRAWVAHVDGVAVGSIWVQVIEKVPNPVPEPEAHAYLTNLYVRPPDAALPDRADVRVIVWHHRRCGSKDSVTCLRHVLVVRNRDRRLIQHYIVAK